MYLAVVAWGTLGPAPGEEVGRAARTAKVAQRAVSGTSTDAPVPDRPRFAGLSGEEAGNIALFVPFGVLAPIVLRRWWWATVPAGVGLSLAIETVQLALLDHRSPQWVDVRWNSTGALIGFVGWLVAAAVWRVVSRPATDTAAT